MRILFLLLTISAAALHVDAKPSKKNIKAAATAKVAVIETATIAAMAAMENEAHRLVNDYRKSKGLKALDYSRDVAAASRKHSAAMASGAAAFGHDGFDERIKSLEKTISYRAAAENVATNMGYDDPAGTAVEGWIKSTGHRKNMEGDFDITGIGIAKNAKGEVYFTQIFFKRDK